MPLIIKAAYTQQHTTIFGNDYNTPDGTCIRDYIHVSDFLVENPSNNFKQINKVKKYKSLNVGLNKGISVLKLIKIFEKLIELEFHLIMDLGEMGIVKFAMQITQQLEKYLIGNQKRLQRYV